MSQLCADVLSYYFSAQETRDGLYGAEVLGLDVDGAQHLGLVAVDHLGEVAGFHLFQQVGGVAGAAVDQGNVSKAIEVSCNYFFFDVGRQLRIDRLVDYASRFGLVEPGG